MESLKSSKEGGVSLNDAVCSKCEGASNEGWSNEGRSKEGSSGLLGMKDDEDEGGRREEE
jgi:hypothetical protein